MNRNILGLLAAVLLLAGCGGHHRDLVSVSKHMDAAVNAHDADAFVGFLAEDVLVKAPDGSLHRGKDSTRAWIAGLLPGFHVESMGWQQSGDTVSWMSTVQSDVFAQMGVNPIRTNTMGVFKGEKLQYFSASLNTESRGKMIFAQFYGEVVNGGNIDAIDKYVSADMVEHTMVPPGTPKGRDGVKAYFTMMREAFPDLHATPLIVLADGDKVFFSGTWEGTQKGKFMGKPASNKKLTWTVADVIRVVDDKAVEHWGWDDMIEMMGHK